MASGSHLVLLTCIISISLQSESVLLFVGDQFEREFSETNVQNDDDSKVITVRIGAVTVTTTPTSDGWFVNATFDDESTKLVVKNDAVKDTERSTFNMTITYPTKKLEVITFYIIGLKVTNDFTLQSDIVPESITISCTYRGDNNKFELKEIYWAVETPGDKRFKVANKTGAFNVVTKRADDTITYTVSKSSSKLIYNVKQTYAAYAGVYGCHIVVSVKDSTLQPILANRTMAVYSKPSVGVYQEQGQFLSGDNVDLECIVDGYPAPNVTWIFSQLKKKALGAASERVEIKDEGGEGKKYSIETKTDSIGQHGFNRRIMSKVTISNVDNTQDRGFYYCSASNTYGSDESKYYLRIRYRWAFIMPMCGIFGQMLALLMCVKLCGPARKQAAERPSTRRNNSPEALMTDSGSVQEIDARQPSRRLSNPGSNPISLEEPTAADNQAPKKSGSFMSQEPKTYRPHELSGIIDEEKEFKEIPSESNNKQG